MAENSERECSLNLSFGRYFVYSVYSFVLSSTFGRATNENRVKLTKYHLFFNVFFNMERLYLLRIVILFFFSLFFFCKEYFGYNKSLLLDDMTIIVTLS